MTAKGDAVVATTHVIIGAGDEAAIGKLAGPQDSVVRLEGNASDARALLELVAGDDKVVTWPWPQAGRSDG